METIKHHIFNPQLKVKATRDFSAGGFSFKLGDIFDIEPKWCIGGIWTCYLSNGTVVDLYDERMINKNIEPLHEITK